MMLQEICEATDRVQDCAAQIAKDGCVIRGKDGAVKDHPALRAELANRAFVVRTLARLLAEAEKTRRGPGRPAVGFGWIPPNAR
jgi:hypothetical protein